MVTKIDKDFGRFKKIVRGKIRENLRKYISHGEMIGKKGKDLVSIPIPQIDIPHFRFDPKQGGGVGQGEGEPGTPLGPGDEPGTGRAGDQPGDHILEELTMEEMAEILGEELELPKIEPRGEKKNIFSDKAKYTGIRPVGPESLRHFKRTYKEALKRQIISGEYNYERPIIVPIRKDQRYRSYQLMPMPQTNAVIIYMMDVSGSMENEQKEIVRTESFWIDLWLQANYKGIVTRYIIHDTVAKLVDRDTFFRTRESGGTIISSAYKLCNQLIDKEFPPQDWNIYPFHFSDGDNWSEKDNEECIQLLKQKILPRVNLFCYGQVESRYGSGKFLKDLKKEMEDIDNFAYSQIESKEDILKSIKDFLGKGK